jgi:hypothetical protein
LLAVTLRVGSQFGDQVTTKHKDIRHVDIVVSEKMVRFGAHEPHSVAAPRLCGSFLRTP